MSSIPSDITCDGKVFPRHNLRDMRPLFVQDTISMASEECLFSSTILRRRCDHSMVGPSPATHSCTSVIIFKVKKSSQQDLLPCCFSENFSSHINKLWLLPCYLRGPFNNNCVTPGISRQTHLEGKPCISGKITPGIHVAIRNLLCIFLYQT